MPKAQLITKDQIAERAFAIWEHEGKPHGRDQEHWERAEAELRDVMARMTPAKPKRAPKAAAKPAAEKAAKAPAKAVARPKAAKPAAAAKPVRSRTVKV